MASPLGRQNSPLIDDLLRQGHRYDFFQAVRLLHALIYEPGEDATQRQMQGVGTDHSPDTEVVRFRALPAHSFPAGSIAEIRPVERTEDATRHRPDLTDQHYEDQHYEMDVAFLGLTGPSGVLPNHYTSLMIERVRAKDYSLRDFFDQFNHRLISLFYRAWQKYRFPFAYEETKRTSAGQDEDLFTSVLYSLAGLGTEGLRDRQVYDDEVTLYYVGHFAHQPRCAASLEVMLCDYFELPIEVQQYYGQWLYLTEDYQTSLPTRQNPSGLNCRLGQDVIVGERVWGVENKFRLRVGPLGYRDFRRLLPTGDVLLAMCQMVRLYVGPHYDFDVQPVLLAAEVPWCQLNDNGGGPRLGWNTWLRNEPFRDDVDDAVFALEGAPI
jgi:type VI secretion system protein ImpH